jgi:hypothetical protein
VALLAVVSGAASAGDGGQLSAAPLSAVASVVEQVLGGGVPWLLWRTCAV